jgi:hypothetical protein
MPVDFGAQIRLQLAVDVGGDLFPNLLAVDPNLSQGDGQGAQRSNGSVAVTQELED